MRLNYLSINKKSKKKKKRLGRGIGSGSGKTCGRGHKGQKSRSGKKIRRGFEGGQMPLYRRLPKFGFNSKKNTHKQEITLSDLKKIKEKTVNLENLKKAKLINQNTKFVKIIFSGKINKAIKIKGIKVSKGAKKQIELNGGKVEEQNIND